MLIAVTVDFCGDGLTLGVRGFGDDVPPEVLGDVAARVASAAIDRRGSAPSAAIGSAGPHLELARAPSSDPSYVRRNDER